MFLLTFSLAGFLVLCHSLENSPCEPGSFGFATLPNRTQCKECPPGSVEVGRVLCRACYMDTFQSEPGQTQCTPCPPGTRSFSNATVCVSCPEGKTIMYDNTCGTCPTGQGYEYHNGVCTPCLSGFYKDEEGFGPCFPCPTNSWSAYGASECISCPEGQSLMFDGSCRTCPPGQWYAGSILECLDCPTGPPNDIVYVPRGCNTCALANTSECFECPVGEVYIGKSRTCEKCQPGQFYNRTELSCEECPPNGFTANVNEPFCKACWPGSYSRRGSSTCFACPLGRFYIAETDKCEECPQGMSYDYYKAQCFHESDPYIEFQNPFQPEEGVETAEPTSDLSFDSGFDEDSILEIATSENTLPTPTFMI